jgi:hypothetical protein
MQIVNLNAAGQTHCSAAGVAVSGCNIVRATSYAQLLCPPSSSERLLPCLHTASGTSLPDPSDDTQLLQLKQRHYTIKHRPASLPVSANQSLPTVFFSKVQCPFRQGLHKPTNSIWVQMPAETKL